MRRRSEGHRRAINKEGKVAMTTSSQLGVLQVMAQAARWCKSWVVSHGKKQKHHQATRPCRRTGTSMREHVQLRGSIDAPIRAVASAEHVHVRGRLCWARRDLLKAATERPVTRDTAARCSVLEFGTATTARTCVRDAAAFRGMASYDREPWSPGWMCEMFLGSLGLARGRESVLIRASQRCPALLRSRVWELAIVAAVHAEEIPH
jgi:hypothetical protein